MERNQRHHKKALRMSTRKELSDIYGEELFKTTTKIQDILKYKPPSLINRIENNYLLTI